MKTVCHPIDTELKGPSQLLSDFEMYRPILDESATHFMVTSQNRTHISHIESSRTGFAELWQRSETVSETTSPYVVFIYFMNQARNVDLLKHELRNSLGSEEIPRLLDILITDGRLWWSALCDDEKCCPHTGKEIPSAGSINLTDRKKLWRQWNELHQKFVSHGTLTEAFNWPRLVHSLFDIKLRDALLSELGKYPEKRSDWLNFLESIRHEHSLEKHVALTTVICAIHYLEGDLTAAQKSAEQALQRDGAYSLALLLHRGLSVKAPSEVLESAFRHVDHDLDEKEVASKKVRSQGKGKNKSDPVAEGFPSRDN
jgi:hypothetical protein